MLRQGADRPGLIATAQTDVEASAGEVVGHGDVLGQPQWIPVRKDQTHLTVPQALRVLSQIDVEHQRVRGDLVALDLEMMLGEHQRRPAVFVGQIACSRSSAMAEP